jgi:hypothetical protein
MHNGEVYNQYPLPNIIRMIKSRRTGWAGHVERLWEIRGGTRFWWADLREGNT